MKRLADADPDLLARVHTVLTDIDDTLTTHGVLPAIAYAALEKLKNAGLRVIPITGRPAGWCDMIARFWPVDGVVGENGAFAFRHDRASRRMIRIFEVSEEKQRSCRARLDLIAEEVVREVPGATVASDQAYRIADLAIDFSEDTPRLSDVQIEQIISIFHRHGAVAKVSSIHVNGWFGVYDKLSMSRRLLREQLGFDPGEAWDGVAYCGDSPNDEPMFRAVPLSVGVANVIDFAHLMTARPRFVTQERGGEGFAELADRLLVARRLS